MSNPKRIEADSREEVEERVRIAARFFGDVIDDEEFNRRVAFIMALDVENVANMKAQMKSIDEEEEV
jgi:hypothetical protein